MVLKVRSSPLLHLSAHPHHYYCRPPGPLQAKGLQVQKPPKVTSKQANETPEKVIKRPQKCYPKHICKSEFTFPETRVNNFTCRRWIIVSRHSLRTWLPVQLSDMCIVWGWRRKLLVRLQQSVIPRFRLQWTSASITHHLINLSASCKMSHLHSPRDLFQHYMMATKNRYYNLRERNRGNTVPLEILV